jgi:CheY-like chemotaxis protein
MSLPRPQAEGLRDTILVVEDDHMIRVSIRGLLEDEGYAVHSVTNGRAALEALRNTSPRPSLILLDLLLPLMDGRTFVAELRRMPELANIPIVVMTACEPADPIEGISGVLRKPLRAQQLLELVSRFR